MYPKKRKESIKQKIKQKIIVRVSHDRPDLNVCENGVR